MTTKKEITLTDDNDNDDPKPILPADVEGYPEIFESCANLVAASEHPRLAITLLLNAVLTIALEVLGREKLERDLHQAIENLPMAATAARGRLA